MKKNLVKFGFKWVIFTGLAFTLEATANRGLPDGTIPVKSAGLAIPDIGAPVVSTLKLNTFGQVDLGANAGFECIDRTAMRIDASGFLTVGSESHEVRGLCLNVESEGEGIEVEYLVGSDRLKGVMSTAGSVKNINARVKLNGKRFQLNLRER